MIKRNFSEKLITKRVIYKFRESGGFNNDWDTTYAILIYIFSKMPKKFIESFTTFYHSNKILFSNPYIRLSILNKKFKANIDYITFNNIKKNTELELFKLAKKAESTGTVSIESFLITSSKSSNDFQAYLSALKNFFLRSGHVNDNLIATIFDEFFYGKNLFQIIHNFKPHFVKKLGLIEKERIIVTKQTMSNFLKIFLQNKIGIISGRSSIATKYTLKSFINNINLQASIFIEDLEKNNLISSNLKIAKPNPYSLFKSLKIISNYKKVLYVGDSMEDLIMVQRGRLIKNIFLFAGVYKHRYSPEKQVELFIRKGADIIIPSINELPLIYEIIKKMVI